MHPDIEEMLFGSQEAPNAKCTLKVTPRCILGNNELPCISKSTEVLNDS